MQRRHHERGHRQGHTHVTNARLEHLDQTLADQPVTRQQVAHLKNLADQAATLVDDAIAAIGAGRADAPLRMLQSKAVAGETTASSATAETHGRRPSWHPRLRRCRSTSAALFAAWPSSAEDEIVTTTPPSTMRPFVLGAVAYDPKVVTIWDGFKAWFADQGFAFDYVLFSNYETQAEAHLRGLVDVTWDSPLAWVRTRRLAAVNPAPARPPCRSGPRPGNVVHGPSVRCDDRQARRPRWR